MELLLFVVMMACYWVSFYGYGFCDGADYYYPLIMIFAFSFSGVGLLCFFIGIALHGVDISDVTFSKVLVSLIISLVWLGSGYLFGYMSGLKVNKEG